MANSKFLNLALAYAGAGLRVFPLQPGKKEPYEGSHGFQDATTDIETIIAWWDENPDSNIGIATGKGLLVIDVDCKDGVNGYPHIEGKDMGDTFVVATPTGGKHYYYRTDEAHQCARGMYDLKGEKREGLDLRCDGGYVVAPGSVRADCGGAQYEPVSERKWSQLAPMTKDVAELVAEHEAGKKARAENAWRSGGPVEPREHDDAVMARARAYVAKIPGAIEHHGGHDQTLIVASHLVVGFLLSNEDALAILREYNARCVPPWSEKELQHKVSEAREKPIRKPGYLLGKVNEDGKIRLANWTSEEIETDKGPKTIYHQRPAPEIAEDIFEALDGFPKVLGGELFYIEDIERDGHKSRAIATIEDNKALFSFLQKRGLMPSFRRGNDATGMDFSSHAHLFSALKESGEKYEAAMFAPFWPPRKDMFCICDELPPPDPDAKAFWNLIDGFMLPVGDEDRVLMAAAFLAPTYYEPMVSHPAWCIDSPDAQGAGKSTVVDRVIAFLYETAPIDPDLDSLKNGTDTFFKELVSAEGRTNRLALFDNLTGEVVKSGALAKIVTKNKFKARAAYGRGVVERANDITWYLTMNGATFDTDLASRTYTFRVKKPPEQEQGVPAKWEQFVSNEEGEITSWEEAVCKYINDNRLQIYADMAGMLERTAARRDDVWHRKRSRCARWDSVVLAAACKDKAEFEAVDAYLSKSSDDTNSDRELAETFSEKLAESLATLDWDGAIAIAPLIMEDFLRSVPELSGVSHKQVREWINGGFCTCLVKGFDRIQSKEVAPAWRNKRGTFLYFPETARKYIHVGENRRPYLEGKIAKRDNGKWEIVQDFKVSAP